MASVTGGLGLGWVPPCEGGSYERTKRTKGGWAVSAGLSKLGCCCAVKVSYYACLLVRFLVG